MKAYIVAETDTLTRSSDDPKVELTAGGMLRITYGEASILIPSRKRTLEQLAYDLLEAERSDR